MNGFTYLKFDSRYPEKGIASAVYFYLLYDVVKDSDRIMSGVRVSAIYRAFPTIAREAVEEVINYLEESGFIGIADGGDVYLGSKGALYQDAFSNDLTPEWKEINILATYYVDAVHGLRSITNAKATQMKLQDMFTVKNHSADYFCELFRCLVTILNQDEMRPFTGKERGQMAYMIKTYAPVVLIKMLVRFVLHCEKYGMGVPTVSALLFHKDTLNKDVKLKSTVYGDEKGF